MSAKPKVPFVPDDIDDDDFTVPPLDVQRDEILESFDFQLMAYTMRFLGWKLSGIDERTGEYMHFASETELQILARRLLNEVCLDPKDFVTYQSAGFVAQKRLGFLNLYFVATSWESTL